MAQSSLMDAGIGLGVIKKLLKGILATLGVAIFFVPKLQADSGHIVVDTSLPGITGPVSVSSTYSIRTDGINWASAQLVVTSATIASQVFNDGQASTFTMTVASYTALSSAAATVQVYISSSYATTGSYLSFGGNNLQSGVQWISDVVYSSNTCVSLTQAVTTYTQFNASCAKAAASTAGSTVTITAPFPGTVYNAYQIADSTYAAMSFSNLVSSSPATGFGLASFLGGLNNQTFSINGVTLQANRDFYPVTSNAVTAQAIMTAINANTNLNTIVVATCPTVSNIVYTTSTAVGTGTQYATSSSSQAALTIATFVSSSPVTSGAVGVMTGGLNASYALNGTTLTFTSATGFGQALGVYFTTGSAVGLFYSTGTTGATANVLPWGTTVYVIVTGSVTVELATTSTGALAGVPITFVSSQTKTTADTFTLNVPALAGTPLISWSVSDNNTNWLPLTTTPFNVTLPVSLYGTYYSTGEVTNYDFGHMDYSYLGLNVTGPTAGAINIGNRIVGNAP